MTETGIATAGIIVARKDRRNTKLTAMTMNSAMPMAIKTSSIARADEGRLIVGDFEIDAGRKRVLEAVYFFRHAVRHVERIGLRLLDHAQTDCRYATDT